ncbi:MAG: hypothetical protein ACM3ML_24645 [Micromonosporaceae bacterium]
MSVRLLTITFNHDTASAVEDALNIRRNATYPMIGPEWVRGMTLPQASPAAYALDEIRGHTLAIMASFERTSATVQTLEIRAIQPPPPPPPAGWPGPLLRLLHDHPWLWHVILWLLFMGWGRNALGDVRPTIVVFDAAGLSGDVRFELDEGFLDRRGVGVYDITWQWEYRFGPGGAWTPFDISAHRIYAVLGVPTGPWCQQPFPSDQNPWTDVLEHACRWAEGQHDVRGAATAVTARVNEKLGLVYDMGGGASAYAKYGWFDATPFLDYLETGAGLGNTVNCTDCATITTTFANALGCDLHASRMGWDFELTPILAIGQAAFGYPAFGSWFGFHEVAWTGQGEHGDALYDACLRVDGDADPWTAPHTALLPTGIPFSTLPRDVEPPLATPFTANSYRERLCANSDNGIKSCQATGPKNGTNNGRRPVK